MSRKTIALLVLWTVSVLSIVSVYSQPSVRIGAGIGFMVPAADFGGTTIDHYNGSAYGFSTGFNLQGKARFGFGTLALVGEIGFASLKNDGNSEPGKGTVHVTQNIFTVRVGPELHLPIPASPVTPYFGASFALHRFSGETRFQGVSKVPSATYSVEAASRFGVGIEAGLVIRLSARVALDLEVGYNFMNLGGKAWTDVNPSQDQRLDTYLALNDARDPFFRPGDDKHVVAGDRTINAFQALLSVLIGI